MSFSIVHPLNALEPTYVILVKSRLVNVRLVSANARSPIFVRFSGSSTDFRFLQALNASADISVTSDGIAKYSIRFLFFVPSVVIDRVSEKTLNQLFGVLYSVTFFSSAIVLGESTILPDLST